jgi:tetratricopeptide (TPR) repeat protein
MNCRLLALVPVTTALLGCGPDGEAGSDRPGDSAGGTPVQEATSLLGEPLYRTEFNPETRSRLEDDLSEAQRVYDANPDDADAIIWLGRRLAYLARYRDAIEVFSEGIQKHPEDPRMYRHRGHRFITVREFDRAIEDFEEAERLMEGMPIEVEPDGAPNPYGIPTSTLQSNVWYHLALAHYLKGDLEKAIPPYLEILAISANDDNLVATTDWLYMTYRRLGRDEDAERLLEPISEDMTILENHSYHRRLLMYKGHLSPEELLDPEEPDPIQFATQGYGVGNWYLYNGQRERAFEVFRQILDIGNWAAFGYLAAEAELARS